MKTTESLLEVMDRMTEALSAVRGVARKPLLGGRFGSAGFVMASYVFTDTGLHEVRYFVLADSGLFFGMGQSKDEALRMAREVMERLGPRMDRLLAEYEARQAAKLAAQRLEHERAAREVEALRKERQKSVPSIPKRRQRIFDESGGRCHYCETVLTLDGKWHIEHKHPRALGGGNEPNNLVASCVPCNMKKRDSTDVEFKARLEQERAA